MPVREVALDLPGALSPLTSGCLAGVAGGRRGHVMVELSMMKADACAAKTPPLLGNMTLGTWYTCGEKRPWKLKDRLARQIKVPNDGALDKSGR